LLAARYLPHTITYPLRCLPSLSHQPIAVTMPYEFTMINIKPLPEDDCLKGKDNWPAWHMQMKAMQRQTRALGHAECTLKCPDPTPKAAGDCCDMALMRYWSSEIGDWCVALLTEVGEEACTALLIFFASFYTFY
jgi:hypothetical protein